MKLPSDRLEKRLTEFQVAVNEQEEIIGAVGICLSGKYGQIHSEAYLDFALADTLRSFLWPRLQSVATNHGLVRLWTTEAAPFWTQVGFCVASDEDRGKLPEDWKDARAKWLTLKLREDIDEVVNLDQEFAMFMDAEKQRSRQMMDQAKMLKLLATLLAVGLFLIVIGIGIWMFMKNPDLLRR